MGHLANLVFFSGFFIGGVIVGFISYKAGFRAGKNSK